MIVEFFGPSGAGKTQTARALGERYSYEYVAPDSSWRRYMIATRFALRSPRSFFFLLWVILSEGSTKPKILKHKLYLLIRTLTRTYRALVRAQAGATVLLDEGLIQRGLSFYDRRITLEEARAYCNHIPYAPVIVIVNAPPEERINRMHARGRIPRGHILGHSVYEREKVVTENASLFRDAWKEKREEGIHIVELHTASSTTAQCVEAIVKAIDK